MSSRTRLQSKTTSDFATNIDQMVNAGCNIGVTVGFMLGDATLAAAKANPDVDFAIVDYSYEAPEANVKGLTFNTAEPSFLAGYLAASLTQTGKVGTFGGAPYPDRDDLHGRLRPGREALQREEGHQRSRSSAGTPSPEDGSVHPRATSSRTSPAASASPTPWSPRAPT